MSFHGGFIGIIIGTWLYSKLNKKPIWKMFDYIALVAPIGIFFGRVANFINIELYGRVTQKPWGVLFPNLGTDLRHASQIYEALTEGLLLGVILFVIYKTKKLADGTLAILFMVLYSVFRFGVEFFREPDSQLGLLKFNLTMGQYLSIIMILTGLIIFKLKKQPIGETNE